MPSTQTRRNLNTAYVGTDCASVDEDVRRGSDIGATFDEETKEPPPRQQIPVCQACMYRIQALANLYVLTFRFYSYNWMKQFTPY
jgi:hypothetical protein